MKRPTQYKQIDRETHVSRWHASGDTIRTYSNTHGIKYNTFKQWCYAWKKQQKIADKDNRTSGSFIPVKVSPKPKKSPPGGMQSSGIPPRFELNLLFGLIHLRIG